MIDKTFWTKRPLSWSSISCFEWNPEEWYDKYILNKKQPETPELKFGKKFALSCENRAPLAPVALYSEVEYELNTTLNGIKLTGWIDTYEPHRALGEFKTGKNPWDQKKVDNHGQLTLYALQLYIQHKVKPEKLKMQLQWVPTIENNDFEITFATDPPTVHTFVTKRTMRDILKFAIYINEVTNRMITYTNAQELSKLPKTKLGR